MENNKRIAELFREIADLLDYQSVQFKPAAYRKAAQTLDDLPHDVSTIATIKDLKKLPGIGEATANKVLEFLKTGQIDHLATLRGEVGDTVSELMRIDDLGPKRVHELQQLGIRTVPQLIAAAQQGKLRTLPRFSELLEKKILANAQSVGERTKRYPLAEVEKDVTSLVKALRKVSGVQRCEAAGSYRRRKETVGDIDILVAFNDSVEPDKRSHGGLDRQWRSEKMAKAIKKQPLVAAIVAQGPTRLAFNLKSGLRVDIRIVTVDQWGSALLYFTGDKEHNIALRKRAIDQEMKLSEYALFKGLKIVASKEEEDIYKALGLEWIEPSERTGNL